MSSFIPSLAIAVFSILLLCAPAFAGGKVFGLCLAHGEVGVIAKNGPLSVRAECIDEGDDSTLTLVGSTTVENTGYRGVGGGAGVFGPGETILEVTTSTNNCFSTRGYSNQLTSPTRHVIQIADTYQTCLGAVFDCDCSIFGQAQTFRVKLKSGRVPDPEDL